MQVNKPFEIELIFNNGFRFVLNTFSCIVKVYPVPLQLTDLIKLNGSLVGFKLIKLNTPTDSVKLINWHQHDFKPRFDYDPLLWLASVATLPVELHQYLIPFHKDLHDTAIS